MTPTQRRYLSQPGRPLQLRDGVAGSLPTIVGYASVFYVAGDPGTEFELCGADAYGPRVVEHILPGAFDRALAEDDVRALANHDPSQILGRTAAGTCKLSVDAVGLRYEITPPDTTAARDLVASIRRGDVTGSSFAFVPRDTSYRDIQADGATPAQTVIEHRDCQLWDVGPVTYPAYAGTAAGVRAADADREAVRRLVSARRRAADRDALAVTLLLIDLDSD